MSAIALIHLLKYVDDLASFVISNYRTINGIHDARRYRLSTGDTVAHSSYSNCYSIHPVNIRYSSPRVSIPPLPSALQVMFDDATFQRIKTVVFSATATFVLAFAVRCISFHFHPQVKDSDRNIPQHTLDAMDETTKQQSIQQHLYDDTIPPHVADVNVVHHGQCQCTKVQFSIHAPRELHAVDSAASKLRFPRVPINSNDFEWHVDANSLKMYSSANREEAHHKGSHIFCAECGTQIVFVPFTEEDNNVEIEVNLDCLDTSNISCIHHHHHHPVHYGGAGYLSLDDSSFRNHFQILQTRGSDFDLSNNNNTSSDNNNSSALHTPKHSQHGSHQKLVGSSNHGDNALNPVDSFNHFLEQIAPEEDYYDEEDYDEDDELNRSYNAQQFALSMQLNSLGHYSNQRKSAQKSSMVSSSSPQNPTHSKSPKGSHKTMHPKYKGVFFASGRSFGLQSPLQEASQEQQYYPHNLPAAAGLYDSAAAGGGLLEVYSAPDSDTTEDLFFEQFYAPPSPFSPVAAQTPAVVNTSNRVSQSIHHYHHNNSNNHNNNHHVHEPAYVYRRNSRQQSQQSYQVQNAQHFVLGTDNRVFVVGESSGGGGDNEDNEDDGIENMTNMSTPTRVMPNKTYRPVSMRQQQKQLQHHHHHHHEQHSHRGTPPTQQSRQNNSINNSHNNSHNNSSRSSSRSSSSSHYSSQVGAYRSHSHSGASSPASSAASAASLTSSAASSSTKRLHNRHLYPSGAASAASHVREVGKLLLFDEYGDEIDVVDTDTVRMNAAITGVDNAEEEREKEEADAGDSSSSVSSLECSSPHMPLLLSRQHQQEEEEEEVVVRVPPGVFPMPSRVDATAAAADSGGRGRVDITFTKQSRHSSRLTHSQSLIQQPKEINNNHNKEVALVEEEEEENSRDMYPLAMMNDPEDLVGVHRLEKQGFITGVDDNGDGNNIYEEEATGFDKNDSNSYSNSSPENLWERRNVTLRKSTPGRLTNARAQQKSSVLQKRGHKSLSLFREESRFSSASSSSSFGITKTSAAALDMPMYQNLKKYLDRHVSPTSAKASSSSNNCKTAVEESRDS